MHGSDELTAALDGGKEPRALAAAHGFDELVALRHEANELQQRVYLDDEQLSDRLIDFIGRCNEAAELHLPVKMFRAAELHNEAARVEREWAEKQRRVAAVFGYAPRPRKARTAPCGARRREPRFRRPSARSARSSSRSGDSGPDGPGHQPEPRHHARRLHRRPTGGAIA